LSIDGCRCLIAQGLMRALVIVEPKIAFEIADRVHHVQIILEKVEWLGNRTPALSQNRT
jgi:hypothetical protein